MRAAPKRGNPRAKILTQGDQHGPQLQPTVLPGFAARE